MLSLWNIKNMVVSTVDVRYVYKVIVVLIAEIKEKLQCDLHKK